MCSALNGHLYQPPKPSRLKEGFGRGGKKNVRAEGQGGGLWTAVLRMWCGCWTQDLTAPVVACTRPACSLSLPECRSRGKSPKPCDEATTTLIPNPEKILQKREVIGELFPLDIKSSINLNSQNVRRTAHDSWMDTVFRKQPPHPSYQWGGKEKHMIPSVGIEKASEKNSTLLLDQKSPGE